MKIPFKALFFASFFGNNLYHWSPITTMAKSPPPKGLYVVVGMFNDSGALLQEAIVYTSGQSFPRQLVRERRRLFPLPILRDIKAFKLYKVRLFCLLSFDNLH